MSGTSLPQEAERLLAGPPDEFVGERKQLERKLRDSGRKDDADTVAGLKKPTIVVFAVNRAARDRPQAARAAGKAALEVKKTQLGDKPEAFRKALVELDSALELLAEVAVAHVSPRGKAPSDAMRRRVHDLLRSAVSDDEAREALVRGALTEELEAVGFSPFAGMAPTAGKSSGKKAEPSPAKQQEAKRRERERVLRNELTEAEGRLREATKAARESERERKAAERDVASLRAKLDRLD